VADVNIKDILDRVAPEVPGCPTQFQIQAMRDTIRDFLQFTRAWIYEPAAQTIAINTAAYAIVLPSTNVQAIAVEFMTLDEAEVRFREVDWLDRRIPNWRIRAADDFRYFTQLQPGTFIFPGIPTVAGTANGLRYRVSIKPTRTATVVEGAQANEWIECWSDGAKARLMMMDSKGWYKPRRGAELERFYRHARANARVRVARSFGNAEQVADLSRLAR